MVAELRSPTTTVLRALAAKIWTNGLRIILIGILAVGLTGCVDYDVGIQFDSQTHGTLTQTLHLDKRFVGFNSETTRQWLKQFERRARSLSGKVKRLDAETIRVTLPFNNGDELVTQFNRLFSDEDTTLLKDVPGLPTVGSSLSLAQSNKFLAIHNHLVYDLDLRQLQTVNATDQGLIGNLRVLDLKFHLVTPWGVQIVETSQDDLTGDSLAGNSMTDLTTAPISQGRETVWQLLPGKINHIDVSFWIPSPIGIGALVIAGIMGLGYLLKYGVKGSIVR